jgi:hypothetical protein
VILLAAPPAAIASALRSPFDVPERVGIRKLANRLAYIGGGPEVDPTFPEVCLFDIEADSVCAANPEVVVDVAGSAVCVTVAAGNGAASDDTADAEPDDLSPTEMGCDNADVVFEYAKEIPGGGVTARSI